MFDQWPASPIFIAVNQCQKFLKGINGVAQQPHNQLKAQNRLVFPWSHHFVVHPTDEASTRKFSYRKSGGLLDTRNTGNS